MVSVRLVRNRVLVLFRNNGKKLMGKPVSVLVKLNCSEWYVRMFKAWSVLMIMTFGCKESADWQNTYEIEW